MTDYIPAVEMKNVFPNTSDQYWATLRHRGTGPTYAKVAGKVFYRRVDLDRWVADNLFTRPDKPVNA